MADLGRRWPSDLYKVRALNTVDPGDAAGRAAQYVPPAKCTHAGITPEYTSGVRKIHIRTGNIAFRMISLYKRQIRRKAQEA